MNPSAEFIRGELEYSPETGEFRRRKGHRAGEIAGSVNRYHGYRAISLGGRLYRAHILAWIYVHGSQPESDIDHINGDKTDNRLSNLRLATRSQNNANQNKLRSDNKSGYRGVHLFKRTGRWKAEISKDGKSRHLGYFASKEQARAAYDAAASVVHGEFYPGQPQQNQTASV